MFLLHNTAAEKSNISLPTPKSIGTTSTNSHSAGCTTSGSTRTSSTSEMLEAISKRLLGAGSSQEESGLDWLEEEDAVIGEDPIGGDIESNQLSSHEHHYSSSSDGAMDDSLVISREELNTGMCISAVCVRGRFLIVGVSKVYTYIILSSIKYHFAMYRLSSHLCDKTISLQGTTYACQVGCKIAKVCFMTSLIIRTTFF